MRASKSPKSRPINDFWDSFLASEGGLEAFGRWWSAASIEQRRLAWRAEGHLTRLMASGEPVESAIESAVSRLRADLEAEAAPKPEPTVEEVREIIKGIIRVIEAPPGAV